MSNKKFFTLLTLIIGIGVLVMVTLFIIAFILEPGASITNFIAKEIW